MDTFTTSSARLEKLQEELGILQNEEKNIYTQIEAIERKRQSFLLRLEQINKSLYEKNVYACHMKEIFRIAKMQFSRLRGSKVEALSLLDVIELNKWIGRVKSEESLKDIVNALNELEKYHPSEIRVNLYALVQKIIIGGAYKQKRKG